jgi:hypothetical protein
MTMPNERTRALIWAAEFLQELSSGTDTPDAIRAQAISVLRHFPTVRSIEQEAERQLRRQQEVTKEAWLLPFDYYARSKSTLQTCQENPELPSRLIQDIMLSIEETKTGQVGAYKFGDSEP